MTGFGHPEKESPKAIQKKIRVMDIQKAQFLNGNTPIGWLYVHQIGGSGNENLMGQESLLFSKSGLPPRYLFKLLRWPEGSSWHNNWKKKKPKRPSPPQRTRSFGKSSGGEKHPAAEISFSCFCRRGNGGHEYEALFRRRDGLIQL